MADSNKHSSDHSYGHGGGSGLDNHPLTRTPTYTLEELAAQRPRFSTRLEKLREKKGKIKHLDII